MSVDEWWTYGLAAAVLLVFLVLMLTVVSVPSVEACAGACGVRGVAKVTPTECACGTLEVEDDE